MSKKYLLRRYDLAGGMDQSTNPFLLADNKFTYLKNVNHGELGTLSKDGGYSTYLEVAGSNSDDLVFDYVNWAGTHLPMKISNGTLYKAGATSWSTVSSSSISAGKRCSAVNYQDKMYWTDEGTNTVRYYDGSSTASISSNNGSATVTGKYLAVIGEQLYLGHITDASHEANEVVWSTIFLDRFYDNTETGFNTYATTSQIFPVDGAITGMKAYQGLLFVFTEDALFYHNPETRETKKLADTGCVAHDTIKEIDGVLYWASRDGIYKFSGQGMPQIISLPITNWAINSIWRLINGSNWDDLNAGVLDGKYYLWVGTLTSTLPGDSVALTNVVVVYDTYRDAWTFYDNHPVRQWATIVDSTGNKKLIMGNSGSGQTFIRAYTYLHNATAIESIIRTKYFAFDNPESEKVLGDLYVSYRPEAETAKYIDVGVAINGDNVYTNYLDSASDTKLPLTGAVTKEYQFERVSLDGLRGRSVSYEFSNDDAGVNVTLLGFSQEFEYLSPNLNYTTS